MISRSNSPTPCVEWVGPDNGRGYGRVWRIKDGLRRKVYIHREVYVAVHGPISARQVVRHSCDNPRCVNPDHLYIGTQLDNMRDMADRGRSRKGRHASHCKHGHAFTPENTSWHKEGYQQCRECRNAPRRKGLRPPQPYKARPRHAA